MLRYTGYTPDIPQSQKPGFSVLNPQELSERLARIEVNVPEYLHELPISDLQRLITDMELLKSEIYNTEDLEGVCRDVEAAVEEALGFATRLMAEYTTLKQKFEQVNGKLSVSNESLTNLRGLETSLRTELEKFESPAIRLRLQRQILESDKVSEQLVESLRPGDSLEDFIKSYRAERKTYHLRKERLERLNEDRVGGLLR